MRNLTVLTACGGVVLAAAVALWSRTPVPEPAGSSSTATALAPLWPGGSAWEVGFRWLGRADGRLADAPLATDVVLVGTLRADVSPSGREVTLFDLRFDDGSSLSVLGTDYPVELLKSDVAAKLWLSEDCLVEHVFILDLPRFGGQLSVLTPQPSVQTRSGCGSQWLNGV
ncbi:MAG TPA: hypothetical protein RMG48_14630 [Myxococcales bacterium LLY-WYZ-16_1]|nr:hypothetical protein [Myxococcales bacterium LLY-WYZ-16_1]